jgi:hypothetical protein
MSTGSFNLGPGDSELVSRKVFRMRKERGALLVRVGIDRPCGYWNAQETGLLVMAVGRDGSPCRLGKRARRDSHDV